MVGGVSRRACAPRCGQARCDKPDVVRVLGREVDMARRPPQVVVGVRYRHEAADEFTDEECLGLDPRI